MFEMKAVDLNEVYIVYTSFCMVSYLKEKVIKSDVTYILSEDYGELSPTVCSVVSDVLM
jgi:hypothetical protein